MRNNENQPKGSIFNAWKVFSNLYHALYCSREKDHDEAEATSTNMGKNILRVPAPSRPKPSQRCDENERKILHVSAAAVVEEGQGHVPEAEPQGSEVSWFEAVKDQQINKVKELIEKGSNLNETDENGWSALHIAAWNNYCPLCEQLISAAADVNLPGPGNSSPLSLAAQRGHCAVVKMLIRAQCDINRTADLADSIKVSALHLAAQYGHSEVVKLLIEAGAVVNSTMTVRGINGVTPLHLAVQNEHLDVMDILIAAGCDVHSSTQSHPSGSSANNPNTQDTGDTNPTVDVMESTC